MNEKSILVVFPHNVNGPRAGVHKRFFELFKYLGGQGFIIDIIGFKNFKDNWNTGEPREESFPVRNYYFFDHSLGLLQKIIFNFALARAFKLFFYKRDKYKTLPDYTFPGLHAGLKKIIKHNHYDFLLVSYVYWADLVKKKYARPFISILTIEDFISQNLHQLYPGDIDLKKSEKEEIRRVNLFDRVICISFQDYKFFKESARRPAFFHIPVFMEPGKNVHHHEKKHDLLFIGSDNENNINGILWFFKQVYPLLPQNLTMLIVGKISGYVPAYQNILTIPYLEDLAEAYTASKISINPLQDGTGMKVKLIEALSYGLPVVSTSKGLSGIRDEIQAEFLFSDDPVKFAGLIRKLLFDTEYYNIQSVKSDKLFRENFSVSAVKSALDEVFNK